MSARRSVRAASGMVATSQPDAAGAGLRALASGGTAVDAAIAMAAALTVVEPCSNGLGSDAFALVWDPRAGRLVGLNGSGRSPASATADALRERGLRAMPTHGWDAVTVPGAVRAWADLHGRFGRLDFGRVLGDAIAFAERGHRVTPTVAAGWAASARRHAGLEGPEFAEWSRVFAPGGRAPRAGETWASPDHAATLRAIAADPASCYTGEIAERIATAAARAGTLLSADDLANHEGEWVQPISTTFRGHRVWEIPPSGQGIAVLEALNILQGLTVSPVDGLTSIHYAIEATKLALADAHAYVADPAAAPVPTTGLLDPAYAAERRALIGARALDPAPGRPPGSDTVYLCAADADGMLVSYIQSNYLGFGSHVVVPGTGIALQNRGAGFSLTAGHPNELAGGKRPFHTIIPGFLTSADGRTPIGPFGVMGGHMQAQGHVQVMLDTLVAGDDPQAALDRPRWFWDTARVVEVEDAALVEPLRALGHDARAATSASFFGRGQIIWRDAAGSYTGGTEPRCDGAVLGQ